MSLTSGFICGTVFALLSASLLAGESNYTFTNLVENSPPFQSAFPTSMNDAGESALVAENGIFVASENRPIVTIKAKSAGIYTLYPPKINKQGDVAFVAELDDRRTYTIYLSRRGEFTAVADTTGIFGLFSELSINDHGQICFAVALKNGGREVYFFNGESIERIATLGPDDYIFSPVMNNKGTIVLHTFTGSSDHRIIMYKGGTATTVADSHAQFREFSGLAVINNHDEVAFHAFLRNGSQGVYIAKDGQITPVVVDRQPNPMPVFDYLSINDRGQVSFRALAGGVFPVLAIQAGPDPVQDNVIKVGDPLFGSTLKFAGIWTDNLNQHGQLSFGYELADGRRGVALATPLHRPKH